MNINDIQIVILDTPYEIWPNKLAKELFTSAVDVKLKAYCSKYPTGVLPVDTCDFIAKHLLLCQKTPHGPKPIMTYRSITLDRCNIHKVKFPMQSMLESCKAEKHLQFLNEVINRCTKNNLNLAYQSSWAVDPSIQADKILMASLRDLMMATVYFFSKQEKLHEIVGAGATRFKADKYFESWGFNGFEFEKSPLSNLLLPTFFNEEVKAIHLSKFSEFAAEHAEKWRFYWNSRITVEQKSIGSDTAKAA